MFDENLATLRRGVDAWNRRDRDAFLATCHPDIENLPPREWLEPDPIRGPEALWESYRRGSEVWGEGTQEIGEVIDAGGDTIAVELAAELRGQVSGVPVEWRYWQVIAFRDGLVSRIAWFDDRADALAAAGVRTPD